MPRRRKYEEESEFEEEEEVDASEAEDGEEPEAEQEQDDDAEAEGDGEAEEAGEMEVDDEDEPAYKPPASVEPPRRTGRRGRPPGSKNKSTIARELASGVFRSTRGGGADGGSHSGTATPAGTPRGRGRGKQARGGSYATPAEQMYGVEDDEYVLPEDPAGEAKVTKTGELLGGRDYRVRTFTLKDRGARLYMLGTEPARCMGFRDAYLLFQKHRRLHKVVLSDAEKHELIERKVIPHSYKGRTIAVVTARSVFREFGARIIVGGKRVFDDYYEREAREQGYSAGELADPDDPLPPPGEPYNKNQYVAWMGATSVYHQYGSGGGGGGGGGAGTGAAGAAGGVGGAGAGGQMVRASAIGLGGYASPTIKREPINAQLTDDNWIYMHSAAASKYNSELIKRRQRSAYEPHTGVVFLPKISQPTRARWQRLPPRYQNQQQELEILNNPKSVEIDTVVRMPIGGRATGLADVNLKIFEDVVSPEIKAAIEAQQQYEKRTAVLW